MSDEPRYGRTASGKPITEELVEQLAEKAEAGFDVEETLRRREEAERFDPDWVISPGETLREWMEENGLAVGMTAHTCRLLPSTIEGILAGEFRISGDVAERLALGTRIPARLWLNLERAYRDGLAAGKKDAS